MCVSRREENMVMRKQVNFDQYQILCERTYLNL